MSNGKTIASFDKSQNEEVRFTIHTRGNRRFLDVRIWRQDRFGDMRQTPDGFSIDIRAFPSLLATARAANEALYKERDQ